jgi:type II secretory pathway pseudopilin PulG
MTDTGRKTVGRGAEAGFTLVEALVAIVVLTFGLMAVTNLMLVAASSNSVANQGTAAVAAATRVMDMLKATSFDALVEGVGQDWEATPGGGLSCGDVALDVADAHCTDDIPGVGSVHVHWWIQKTTDTRLRYVRVQAQGLGALSGARSRAEFTTFRACTNIDGGCPAPGATPTPSPSPTP